MESHATEEVIAPSRANVRSKTDPAWAYVNETIEGNAKPVYTCLCCDKKIKGGGISRMKRHLAGIRGDVASCLKVPNEVREEMLKTLNEFEQNKKVLAAQKRSFNEMDSQSSRDGDSSIPIIITPKVKPSNPFMQRDLKSAFAGKDAALRADRAVARWFYEQCFQLSAIDSPLFPSVVENIVRAGYGYKIVRPAVTRFATTFLTLSSILERQTDLEALVISDFFRDSPFSKTEIGKTVKAIVLDQIFWDNCLFIVKLTTPIVQLLRIVDSDSVPALGYVHDGMIRVEKVVKSICNNVEARYMPYLNILDQRWDKHLNRDLIVAAYFFNPVFLYSGEFENSHHVNYSLLNIMSNRLWCENSIKAMEEMTMYKERQGSFGRQIAIDGAKVQQPGNILF
ncbi:hypothetical protein LINGRAHAP2_LOCUS34784 [Linum grandiflorum]